MTDIPEKGTIPVAGVVPLTTVDYPGRLALVVFTQGCPWRCGYCHNTDLLPIGQPTSWRWQQVCDLLDERRGFLQAVVFSGGEPTLHKNLATAMKDVRKKNLLVGLHTAGIFPDRLVRLLPWLNWVGLDIKAPFDKRYVKITGDNNTRLGYRPVYVYYKYPKFRFNYAQPLGPAH